MNQSYRYRPGLPKVAVVVLVSTVPCTHSVPRTQANALTTNWIFCHVRCTPSLWCEGPSSAPGHRRYHWHARNRNHILTCSFDFKRSKATEQGKPVANMIFTEKFLRERKTINKETHKQLFHRIVLGSSRIVPGPSIFLRFLRNLCVSFFPQEKRST